MSKKPRLTKILTEQFPSSGPARIGVVADTHIPDRMRALPPRLFDVLRGVDWILHAGDICTPRVLDELKQIAPVLAVLGNRDFLYRGNWSLPQDRIVEIGGVRIGLTHGHGGARGYIKEKILYYTTGYYLDRYDATVQARFSGVEAIVFGHSHHPVNQVRDGVLLFNPGSVGPEYKLKSGGSAGVLTVCEGKVRGEIVDLTPRPPSLKGRGS